MKLAILFFLILHRFCFCQEWSACPKTGCPDLSSAKLNLSYIAGSWDSVFYTQLESSQKLVPHLFNFSLCGPLPPVKGCESSSVCYTEHFDQFYDFGSWSQCKYRFANKTVQFQLGYGDQAKDTFGAGVVTITLACGQTLGLPEVTAGDPSSGSIDVIWFTSAACRTDGPMAPVPQSKCYYVHTYKESGIQVHLYDLAGLVRDQGYVASYAERDGAKFKLGVCQGLPACGDALACLDVSDPRINIYDRGTPLPLATRMVSLGMEGGMLTAVYENETSAHCQDTRRVKVHFICPTDSKQLGPSVVFMDDNLCLVVVNWYTSYGCSISAIESSNCQLVTTGGLSFDLSPLKDRLVEVNTTLGGSARTYELQICGSPSSINTDCGRPPSSPAIHVAQFDSDANGVCRSLGQSTGKLRYADRSLTLTYTGGDPCQSNYKRTSVINFVCPKTLKNTINDSLTFLSEDSCYYQFQWVTPVACGSRVSGGELCNLKVGNRSYSFTSLALDAGQNWVAVDDEPETACYMLDPCGMLEVTGEKYSPVQYCERRVAPPTCAQSSVCQIMVNGSAFPLGRFDLGDSATITPVDGHVFSVRTKDGDRRPSVVRHVCKPGDLASVPVHVGTLSGGTHEFHWASAAACPAGTSVGDDCAVTQEGTGFVFDLSPISAITYNRSDQGFSYEVAICSPVNGTHCDDRGAGVCQQSGAGQYKSAGQYSDTLSYIDGSLKLVYSNGTLCGKSPGARRNSTLVFQCDRFAHTPSVTSVTEVGYCQYLVEVSTKLACPPAFRATECLYVSPEGDKFDFSPLVKTSGGWQAAGPQGSTVHINLCQPLSGRVGCHPLASVCSMTSGPPAAYATLGLAGSANFTFVLDHVVLRYNFTDPQPGAGQCGVVETMIEFVCSNVSEQAGPQYISGGDEANPCQYSFVWRTQAACHVHAVTTLTCTVTDPVTGYEFDLSPLHAAGAGHFTVADQKTSYNITACGPLTGAGSGPCTAGDTPLCQVDSNGVAHSLGQVSTQRLSYFEGSLTLTYSGGEVCRKTGKERTVVIDLDCDRSVYIGTPRYIQEDNCSYTFVWPTALACPPRELQCMAGGGRYDMRPLLQQRNWVVDAPRGGGGSRGTYVIGGCRSLDVKALPLCPQQYGIGACRYSAGKEGERESKALGFVTGELVVSGEGELSLTYHNGDTCVDGKSSMVRVHFRCSPGKGAGVPVLAGESEDHCETTIDWPTQYACPLNAVGVHEWKVKNPSTGHMFDLTNITSVLSANYTQSGRTYTYTIGLGNHTVPCPGTGVTNIGACQTSIASGKSFALGVVSDTLQFAAESIRTEYRGGTYCHLVKGPRKAVILFECDDRDDFLEVLPEEVCEYTFVVHTRLVCVQEQAIGVECDVPGYQGLGTLASLTLDHVPLKDGGTMFVSVCRPISVYNQRNRLALLCPRGAAACSIDASNVTHDLGHPSMRYPPVPLNNGNGVLLNYTSGEGCGPNKLTRATTQLMLICNNDKPIGVPEVVSSSACTYVLKWETALACPSSIYSTPVSRDLCAVTNPSTNQKYNFTDHSHFVVHVPDMSAVYHVSLCGGAAGGCPPGTGVCMEDAGRSLPLLHSDHRFTLVSRSPVVIDVMFPSGESCKGRRKWSALLTIQCSPQGGTEGPVFVTSNDCELQFLWKTKMLCSGAQECVAIDPVDKYVFDLDALLSKNWQGVTAGNLEGTYTLAVCRNLNPFRSAGDHCSSPAGICLEHDEHYKNLGHMVESPKVLKGSIVLNYTDGDLCSDTVHYSAIVNLKCSPDKISMVMNQLGDCQFVINWETPLACKATTKETTNCKLQDQLTGLQYDFSPLAKPLEFSDAQGGKYKVCLCPGGECQSAYLQMVAGGNGSGISLGSFQKMDVVGFATGPQVLFTGGDTCGQGSARSQAHVFMECDRTVANEVGTLVAEKSLSTPCEKYFLWDTPYACLSDEVTCTLGVKDWVYDFAPLYPNNSHWETKGNNGDIYYINICGPARDLGDSGACGADAAVCVIRNRGANSFTFEKIAYEDTQQIKATYNGNVQFVFRGPPQCPGTSTMVVITMVCGIEGLKFVSNVSCSYSFIWSTLWACRNKNSGTRYTGCPALVAEPGSLYTFQPSKLSRSNGYVVDGDSDGKFYVNVCGGLDKCGPGNSACVEKQGTMEPIAAVKTQEIIINGYWMEIRMNSTLGTRHTVVTVECRGGNGEMSFVNAVPVGSHIYYYFRIQTDRCDFNLPPLPHPKPNGNTGGGGGGGDSGTGGDGASTSGGRTKQTKRNSSGLVIVVLLVGAFIIVLFLVALLYKKTRRDYVKAKLIHLISGRPPEGPAYYQMVPLHGEEEDLLYEKRNKTQTARRHKDGANSDEELVGI